MLKFLTDHRRSRRQRELAALELFVDLGLREMQIVDGLVHERHYLKGEVIFDQGEEGQAIYFILQGKVIICPQGCPESPIVTLERGNSFGELALLDDAPRSAQARAAEDCTLAVFFFFFFLGLMGSHAVIASKISLRLARQLGARLRGAQHAALSDRPGV